LRQPLHPGGEILAFHHRASLERRGWTRRGRAGRPRGRRGTAPLDCHASSPVPTGARASPPGPPGARPGRRVPTTKHRNRRCPDGGYVFSNPSELVKYVQEEDVEFIDIRFCDLPGVMQHFNIPAASFDEEAIATGQLFDGSSIR